MYFGNRGVHPSVMATLTEGRGAKKPVIKESVDFDPMVDDLIVDGQVNEGIMDFVRGAADFFKKYWGLLKYKLGAGLPANFSKDFAEKYIKDPKQAMDHYRKSLLDVGTDPADVEKRVASTRKAMETAIAMRNGIKAGAKGQNSKMLMAMANASQKMNSAGNDPKVRNSIFRNALGAVTAYAHPVVQQQPAVRQQPAVAPAQQQPAPTQQPAQGTPQAKPIQQTKKTITVDGKFYDGQRVQVSDAAGNLIQGRVKLVDEANQQPGDDSDYVVVDQQGKVIGSQKTHAWEATDPSESPAVNPPKADPPRIKAGPGISQSIAAASQQPPAAPATGNPPPAAPGAAAAVPAPTPPPTKPTTQTLASPAAPVQPAAVPKQVVTKPAPSRARKNP